MKKFLIILLLLNLVLFNKVYSKTLEVGFHKIEISNNYSLIDWSDVNLMSEYCRDFNICYGIIDKNLKKIVDELNSGKSYEDIKILKPIVKKYEKMMTNESNFEKNTKSLIKLIKSTLKKNNSGIIYNYYKSDQNIYEAEIILDNDIDIDEIKNMSSSELNQFAKELKDEITSGRNYFTISDGLFLNFNKFYVKKNSNKNPYLIFNGDLKYIIGSSTIKLGDISYYLSETNNKLFVFEGYCLVNCSGFFSNFSSIVDQSFNQTIQEINSNASNSNDLINQIENLNDLYKSGVLTKEEFEKAKKKLLN
tara:strand:+ start:99 stop:1019 length:921 start_codon:yes stop_codon:yes gene_type:complete